MSFNNKDRKANRINSAFGDPSPSPDAKPLTPAAHERNERAWRDLLHQHLQPNTDTPDDLHANILTRIAAIPDDELND